MNNKKVFANIYCKNYTDNFSDEMVDRMATGKEIYEFLMKDARQCFDDRRERLSRATAISGTLGCD